METSQGDDRYLDDFFPESEEFEFATNSPEGWRNPEVEDQSPIGRRTRAHLSLQEKTLEEVEALFPLPVTEGVFPFLDDKDEYDKFLAALDDRCAPFLREREDDEDEDEDVDFRIDDEAVNFELDHISDSSDDEDDKAEDNVEKTKEGAEKPETRRFLRRIIPAPVKQALPRAAPLQPQTPLASFLPEQIAQLHSQILEATQLLVMVHAMSVQNGSAESSSSPASDFLKDIVKRRQESMSTKKTGYCINLSQRHYRCSKCQGDGQNTLPAGCGHLNLWKKIILKPVRSVFDSPLVESIGKFIEVANQGSGVIKFPLHFTEKLMRGTSTGVLKGYKKKKSQCVELEIEKLRKNQQRESLIPSEAVSCFKLIEDCLKPCFFPKDPLLCCSGNRSVFSKAEDRLLAAGISIYNSNFELIRKRFLPGKTAKQIRNRVKNCVSRCTEDNPVKRIRLIKEAPLSEEEVIFVNQGVKLDKVDMEGICLRYLKHRDPRNLQRLYRNVTGELPRKRRKQAEVLSKSRGVQAGIMMGANQTMFQLPTQIQTGYLNQNGILIPFKFQVPVPVQFGYPIQNQFMLQNQYPNVYPYQPLIPSLNFTQKQKSRQGKKQTSSQRQNCNSAASAPTSVQAPSSLSAPLLPCEHPLNPPLSSPMARIPSVTTQVPPAPLPSIPVGPVAVMPVLPAQQDVTQQPASGLQLSVTTSPSPIASTAGSWVRRNRRKKAPSSISQKPTVKPLPPIMLPDGRVVRIGEKATEECTLKIVGSREQTPVQNRPILPFLRTNLQPLVAIPAYATGEGVVASSLSGMTMQGMGGETMAASLSAIPEGSSVQGMGDLGMVSFGGSGPVEGAIQFECEEMEDSDDEE